MLGRDGDKGSGQEEKVRKKFKNVAHFLLAP